MQSQELSLLYACLLALAAVSWAYKGTDDNKSFNEVEKVEKEEKGDDLSVYSKLMLYYLKKKQPWLMLPNNGYCFQHGCRSDTDCCRKFNICDQSANVCIDCWYGFPCSTSADCCERYPQCEFSNSKHRRGRCTDSNYAVKRLQWAKK